MKRKQLSMAIHGVLAVSLLATIPAFAQEAPAAASGEQKTTTLESIKVTARKREETLQEVPVAVTAFTSDALDKLNIKDIGDLDAQVPNLTIYAARGSSSAATAYIRGVGQSDTLWGVDPGVGIYLDDVYIARPQGALLDVFDVERIEVLRGPQGTLYGKNTIGGAIKYISKGLRSDFNGYGSITVGNYGQRDIKAAVGGGFGGSEYLRGRISVAKLHNDGFGENIVTGEPVSNKEITAVRAQLGAYVNDDVDIQFALDWMDDTSGMRGAKMLAVNRHGGTNVICLVSPALGVSSCPPVAATPNNSPLDSRYDIRSGMPNINDTKMLGASATVNWKINDNWGAKYIIAKRESDTETNIDFDTLQEKVADVKAFYSDQQVSNEFQLNYDGGGRARGVVGLYLFDGEAGGQVLNTFWGGQFATHNLPQPPFPPLWPVANYGDTQGTVYTESLSLYADWTFDLTDRLALNVGARYTDEDKHAIAYNIGYTNGTFTVPNGVVAANFDKTVNFKNVSPKVSLDFQVTDDIMLYALASRGFKSGGYNIRANTTAVPRSGEPFDDESVDSYELGSKMVFFDQRLFLNLAAFHNVYKDIQLSVFTALPAGGFFGDFTIAGKGTVNGAEFEYQWLPTANWVVSGNLAWLDAKYDEFITSGINVADSQRFTNAPEFSGAFNVEYRTELANAGNLSARVGYSYQSEVWPTTDLSSAIRQDGYGLVNAGVIWKVNDAWSLSLQGSNLADKEYRTTGYNLVAAQLGALTGFYGAPRQYSLTVKYDF